MDEEQYATLGTGQLCSLKWGRGRGGAFFCPSVWGFTVLHRQINGKLSHRISCEDQDACGSIEIGFKRASTLSNPAFWNQVKAVNVFGRRLEITVEKIRRGTYKLEAEDEQTAKDWCGMIRMAAGLPVCTMLVNSHCFPRLVPHNNFGVSVVWGDPIPKAACIARNGAPCYVRKYYRATTSFQFRTRGSHFLRRFGSFPLCITHLLRPSILRFTFVGRTDRNRPSRIPKDTV